MKKTDVSEKGLEDINGSGASRRVASRFFGIIISRKET